MGRRTTGKRLRFEIFKRDGFTCQYCGAQPPEVVLVLDHITPIAKGGQDVAENLITSCEACNQGKADKLLSDAAVRPDANQMYLATLQEISELERFQQSTRIQEQAIRDAIVMLQDLWCEYSELEWAPSENVLRPLLRRYNAEVVGEATRDVALKVAGGYLSEYGSVWVRYLNGVARNMAAGKEAGG